MKKCFIGVFSKLLVFILIFALGLVPVPMVSASTTADLVDIEFNGGSVPGFAPAILEYDLVVPYQYIENDFSTYTMPVVNATAADENAEVEVVYPAKVKDGTILINVTNGSLSNQYKLNLIAAGSNYYWDGGFEDNDTLAYWKGADCTISYVADTSAAGSQVMKVAAKDNVYSGYNRYYLNTGNIIALPQGKTYLASNMVKSETGATLELEERLVHDGSSLVSGLKMWTSDGEFTDSRAASVTGAWQTRQSTFQLADSGTTLFSNCYRPYEGSVLNVLNDEFYVGELLISSVEVKNASGKSTEMINIPTETRTIDLSASVLNQMGTKAGFVLSGDDANVNMSWRVLGNPAGVSVSNGVVTVTSDAEPGTIIVEAVAQPTYLGAAQTEVSGRYRLVIDGMQYKANDQVIQTIGGHKGDVVCALNYTNDGATACDIRFFTAVYKKVGNKLTLEDVVSEGYTVQPSKSVTDELTVTIPNDGNVYVIKSFVWDNNLCPKMVNGFLQ